MGRENIIVKNALILQKKAMVSYCENEVLGHPILQGKEMIEFKVG